MIYISKNEINKNDKKQDNPNDLRELLSTGIYETITPKKASTVSELLKERDLKSEYFVVLVNGRKVKPDAKITPDDIVVIMPLVAGGFF